MSKPSQHELDIYADENEALAAFRRAQADLYAHTAGQSRAGITHETDEYARLNQAVIDAAKRLPKRFKHLAKGV